MLGGPGAWERSQTTEHWGGERLLLAVRPQLQKAVQASGKGWRGSLQAWRGLPHRLQAQRPVSEAAGKRGAPAPPPPPVSWELEGFEGISQAPPFPGQLLQNLPAPTFHPLLKGKCFQTLPVRISAAGWTGRPPPGRGRRRTPRNSSWPSHPGPRPFPTSPHWPPSGGKRPKLQERSAPGSVRTPTEGSGSLFR